MELEFEQCYRAVQSRDDRFDGRFFTCVTSTMIYCRPSCPALTPKPANVRFLPTAAAAQLAGFRACLRCRPDASPGDPQWSNRADVAARAMRLIADGIVDRSGVDGLAGRIGYTPRHLGRLLTAEVGAGPLALARAQRAQTARLLIETTAMGLAEVAFAAGFGSVRQFNDTMLQTYGRPPSALRTAPATTGGAGVITLRLPYREPLHAEGLLEFLAARTIPGVDAVVGDRYDRTLRLPHGRGQASLTIRSGRGFVEAVLELADLRDLAPAVARCRRLLDLDADPVAVDAVLAGDPMLAAAVEKEPGVRVPGAVDGFELAVRAVVGQQISVAGARAVLTHLVAAVGGLGFPTPAEVTQAPDEAFRMPTQRRATVRRLAAAAAGDLCLDPGADRDETRARLLALPGIGPWTAQYVAMRALGDPDVLMATDLGVLRGAAAAGLPTMRRALEAHAQDHWAPWRSYATMRLWRSRIEDSESARKAQR